ncbi:hypothetical protein Ccrd_019345 [Cynara cardunculus var. scolymus]|uniref:Uncharacterized protein n=1 Tax=Cynara cardunculus var. scolymus TaxID=59895 RepID=A0A118K1F3_CYNCS|nr:hypothetical protein Ccrd_019345 [Cynara cardunculus var. scolymus]
MGILSSVSLSSTALHPITTMVEVALVQSLFNEFLPITGSIQDSTFLFPSPSLSSSASPSEVPGVPPLMTTRELSFSPKFPHPKNTLSISASSFSLPTKNLFLGNGISSNLNSLDFINPSIASLQSEVRATRLVISSRSLLSLALEAGETDPFAKEIRGTGNEKEIRGAVVLIVVCGIGKIVSFRWGSVGSARNVVGVRPRIGYRSGRLSKCTGCGGGGGGGGGWMSDSWTDSADMMSMKKKASFVGLHESEFFHSINSASFPPDYASLMETKNLGSECSSLHLMDDNV